MIGVDLIVDVLEYYADKNGVDIRLERVHGYGWRTIRCPFHDDHHPSGRVNLSLNAFWCPVCGMSGDAIKIIEKQEVLDFKEACEFAEGISGKSLSQLREATGKTKARRRPGRRHSLFD